MMIRRRTFILSVGLGATTPALAYLQSFLSTARAQALPPPNLFPPPRPSGATDANGVVFRIEGWDVHTASMRSDASLIHDSTGGEVWITLNQSWRTAWR
jgi:hypothetical protein